MRLNVALSELLERFGIAKNKRCSSSAHFFVRDNVVAVVHASEAVQMVESRFANLEIEVWVADQKLGLTQPTLCLNHDQPRRGIQFLEALRELNDGACPAKLTLTFAACAHKKAIGKLALLLVHQSEVLKVMNISCREGVASVQITNVGLSLLVDAFALWLGGSEDFGVSARHSSFKPWELGQLDRESGEVWFWGPGYLGP